MKPSLPASLKGRVDSLFSFSPILLLPGAGGGAGARGDAQAVMQRQPVECDVEHDLGRAPRPVLAALDVFQPRQMTADIEKKIGEPRAGRRHRRAEALLGGDHGFGERGVRLLSAPAAHDGRSEIDAEARQVAMYLTHTVFRMSFGAVARGFGRDRTTARHACRHVEEMRDDPERDRLVAWLEMLLRETAGEGPGSGGAQ